MILRICTLFLIICGLSCNQKVQRTSAEILETHLPATITPLPWSDNFDHAHLESWQIIQDAPTNERTWRIEQGLLVQGSRAYLAETKYQNYLGTHIVSGDPRWKNYRVEATFHNLDQHGVGLIFRYLNSKNYYRFLLVTHATFGGPRLRLDKFQNGLVHTLKTIDGVPVPPQKTSYSIAAEANEDTLRIYLAHQLVAEVRDAAFSNGKIGFTCFHNAGLLVDAVRVTGIPGTIPFDTLTAVNIHPRFDHFSGSYSFTIRGIVFADRNGNGQQEPDEPGLSQIAVSDGADVVLTDVFGVYSLLNSQKDAQFVYVNIPANFKKEPGFYYLLHDSLGQRTFNFALHPTEAPEPLPARLVQISDLHVQDEKSQLHLRSLLRQLYQLSPRPQLILATGDLVEKGSVVTQMLAYQAESQLAPIPIYSVCGNHDLDNGLNRLALFHQLLGPDYYTFDYANFHCISYNSTVTTSKQTRWLEKDLEIYGSTKNILIFRHYPPTKDELDFLKKYPVKAIFSGHWHSNKILNYAGITCYNTPPFRFGGIDNSPAGFRSITLEPDSIHSQYRFISIEKQIQVVSPVPGIKYANPHLQILVNIYDSRDDIIRVNYQLFRPNNFNEFGELTARSDWTWEKLIPEPLFDGDFMLKLTIWNSERQHATLELPFTAELRPELQVQRGEPCPMFKRDAQRTGFWPQRLTPPLALKWTGITGGSIDFAAPIVLDTLVAIATTDRHNLGLNAIHLFQSQTGLLKWCFETETAVHHSLVAHQGQLIGQEVNGTIFSLEMATGELLWKQTLSRDPTEFWLYATPVVHENRLFAGNTASLAAIEIENGIISWQKKLGAHWISSYAAPSLYLGQILIGGMWAPNHLFALDLESGARVWEYPGAGLHGAVLVQSDVGYFGTQTGHLVALNLKNGREQWRVRICESWIPTTPSCTDSLVITGSGDGRLIAVNRTDGKIRWQFQCQPSIFICAPYQTTRQALTGSPVITGDLVYSGATDGRLYALKAATGEMIWQYNLGAPILSTPAIAGNALYIAAYDGNVYCFVSQP